MRILLPRSCSVVPNRLATSGARPLFLCLAIVVAPMLTVSAVRADAPPAQAAVACAVDGPSRGPRPADLCRAVGRELKRPTPVVEDARATKSGPSLQIIRDDVQWIVAWLVDGHVRAWTRVSKIEAASDQLRFLVIAVRELAKMAPTVKTDCVRVEPSRDPKLRSPDLTYPWTELAPCKRQSIEIVDPWP